MCPSSERERDTHAERDARQATTAILLLFHHRRRSRRRRRPYTLTSTIDFVIVDPPAYYDTQANSKARSSDPRRVTTYVDAIGALNRVIEVHRCARLPPRRRV